MSNETETTEAATEEKVARVVQNGVTRPREGSKTGLVWAIADRISAETGAPAKRAAVLEACEAEGVNKSTATTQFGRWRVFHGVKPEPKAPKKSTPKKEKAASEGTPIPENASKSDEQTKIDNDAADAEYDAEQAAE